MMVLAHTARGVDTETVRPRMNWFSRPRDFEKSVQPELAVLYRVARRLGGNAEQAEDLVQTTLIKAYQAWERFDGRHLRSWLIRILRNEFLMNVRSARPELSLANPKRPKSRKTLSGPIWRGRFRPTNCSKSLRSSPRPTAS